MMIKAVICLLILFVSFALDPFRALFERHFYYNRNFRNLQVFSNHGLRMNYKLGIVRGDTGRSARPDLRQGRDAPGPSLGEKTCRSIPNKHRLTRWGLRKFEASGPRKPGKSQGKSLLFPGDYSPAFPGCFASGLAAFSRQARSITAAD
jgi:hypothetical protein